MVRLTKARTTMTIRVDKIDNGDVDDDDGKSRAH